MWGEERRDAVFTFGLVWRGWGCVGGALSGLEDVLLWVTWGDAPGWYRLLLWSKWREWCVGVGEAPFQG